MEFANTVSTNRQLLVQSSVQGVKGVPQFRNAKQIRSEEAAAPGNDQIDEPPAEGETVHVDQPPN
ncbi:hypothetical protein OUZ56_005315 [Daphnia magna]|uniref:Uncharacterized protein n=1 Tax=Daphnia magna TaxID=35525 RepID=A0ABQ9YSG8_9CRUS|nr:hypothetical protein OUZ56_005315 [Daphnia magna]